MQKKGIIDNNSIAGGMTTNNADPQTGQLPFKGRGKIEKVLNNKSDLCCMKITRLPEVELVVTSIRSSNIMPGESAVTMQWIAGHEGRRVEVYKRAYDAYINQLEKKVLNISLECNSCESAKKGLHAYLNSVYQKSLQQMTEYVAQEQAAISQENIVYRYVEQGNRIIKIPDHMVIHVVADPPPLDISAFSPDCL